MSLRATNRSEAISIPVLVVIASPSLGFQAENGFLIVIASPLLSSLRVLLSAFRPREGRGNLNWIAFGQPPKDGSLAMTKCKQRYEILYNN